MIIGKVTWRRYKNKSLLIIYNIANSCMIRFFSLPSIIYIYWEMYVMRIIIPCITMIILLTMLTCFIILGMYLGLWQVSIQELIIFMSPVIIVVVGLTLIRRKANR